MAIPEIPQEENSKICFLDFSPDDLLQILGNKTLSAALSAYDESSALTHIDELINLNEAPSVGLLLNEKSILDVRSEWTVTVPVSLAEDVRSFVRNKDQQK